MTPQPHPAPCSASEPIWFAVCRVLSVVANAEEAHAGWRLLDGDSNQISGDIRYKHVLDQAPRGLPVLVLDHDRAILHSVVLVGVRAALVLPRAHVVHLLAFFGGRPLLLELRGGFLQAALLQPAWDSGGLGLCGLLFCSQLVLSGRQSTGRRGAFRRMILLML